MGQLRKQLDAIYTLADGSMMEQININSSTPGLLLVKLNKKQYALSWAHFTNAEYFPAASDGDETADDRIEMEFTSRLVTLHGRNLGALMENIMEHRISRVPESPDRYLMTDHVRVMRGAMVMRIEVTKRNKN